MLLQALDALRDAGITASHQGAVEVGRLGARLDPIIDVAAGELRQTFAFEEKSRAPYPNEIPRLDQQRETLSRHGQPLLLAPFVSEPLGRALTAAGWSWADEYGNFDLRAPGLLLAQRRAATRPRPRTRQLPRGSGGFAIIRALIRFGPQAEEKLSATGLAKQAGVSQPRASQVLQQLHALGLVDGSHRTRWQPDREALLDRFLAEYPGPGTSERYLYSLDSPIEVALAALRTHSQKRPTVVSADVGPDLILAWRRPSVLILYTAQEISSDDLGLVEAQGRHDANVIIRVPDDRSVYPNPELTAKVRDMEVPLADPSQMIWDLQQLGGADRLEAAGRLREWVLNH